MIQGWIDSKATVVLRRDLEYKTAANPKRREVWNRRAGKTGSCSRMVKGAMRLRARRRENSMRTTGIQHI